jgi:PPOX class probable F420-dependent enzyme
LVLPEPPTTFAIFGGHPCLSLTTFDREGQPITCRVRFAQDGDKLYVTCTANADFVERIHDNAQVEVAPCNERGEMIGRAIEAMAVVLPQARASAARRLFGGHSLGERLHEWMLILSGSHTVCLEITPM